MSLLKRIFYGDPYDDGPSSFNSNFAEELTFTGKTNFGLGYKISYVVLCHFYKTDPYQFRVHNMLDLEARLKYVHYLHGKVVLPELHSKRRFFLLSPRRPFPILCRLVDKKDGISVVPDYECMELNSELKFSSFKQCGCTARIVDVRIPEEQPEDLVEENYEHMKKKHDVKTIESHAAYIDGEESIAVALAHRQLELRRTVARTLVEQTHKGSYVSIEVQLVAEMVKISWTFNENMESGATLRGFRKQGGFAVGNQSDESNGMCIVEARESNSATFRLSRDEEHYFTFIAQSPRKAPETLRFAVRVPSREEEEELLAPFSKVSEKAKTPAKQKIDAALQELLASIQFDESLADLEKDLLKRASSSDGTPEEQAERQDRIRFLVAQIRLRYS